MSLHSSRSPVALSYREDACGCDTPGRQTTDWKLSGVERQAFEDLVTYSQILLKNQVAYRAIRPAFSVHFGGPGGRNGKSGGDGGVDNVAGKLAPRPNMTHTQDSPALSRSLATSDFAGWSRHLFPDPCAATSILDLILSTLPDTLQPLSLLRS